MERWTMRTLLSVAFTCIAAATVASNNRLIKPTKFTRDDWRVCENGLDGESCATLQVPLCYEGICSDTQLTLSLTVFGRIVSSTKVASRRVWLVDLSGGSYSQMRREVARVLGSDADVYQVAYRQHATERDRDWPYKVGNAAVRQDLADLARTYGAGNAAAFSFTSAAHDVITAMRAVSGSDTTTETFIYASGWSTVIAKRLMELAPKYSTPVRGYILDNIRPDIISTSDADYGQVADQFIAQWSNDSLVQEKFGPRGIRGALEKLYAQDRSECLPTWRFTTTSSYHDLCFGDCDSKSTGLIIKDFVSSLLRNWHLQPLVPAVIYRLGRCSAKDQEVLRLFYDWIDWRRMLTLEHLMLYGTHELYLAASSEMWEMPAPARSILRDREDEAIMTSGVVARLVDALCAYAGSSWKDCKPVQNDRDTWSVYSPDQLAVRAMNGSKIQLPSGTNVLIWSSRGDVLTPTSYATEFLERLQGGGIKTVVKSFGPRGYYHPAFPGYTDTKQLSERERFGECRFEKPVDEDMFLHLCDADLIIRRFVRGELSLEGVVTPHEALSGSRSEHSAANSALVMDPGLPLQGLSRQWFKTDDPYEGEMIKSTDWPGLICVSGSVVYVGILVVVHVLACCRRRVNRSKLLTH